MLRTETYKKRPLGNKWIIVGLLFAFLMVISSILLLLLYPFASSEQQSYFTGDNPLIFEGQQFGNAIVEGESVYLPLSFLKEKIDDSIVFDEKSNSIIITTKDKVVQMPSESVTYFVNEKPVDLHFSAFKTDGNEMYLAIDPLLNYYPIEYSILPDSNAVWLKTDGQEITYGTVTDKDTHEEKLRLRTDSSLQSPYRASVVQNETITIEGEKEDYYYVRKESGIAGYLNKALVTKGETETVVAQHEEKEFPVPQINGPINLTWEAVYTKNPDTSKLPAMPGVNVVSPTWFELANENGEIKNLGSLQYVQWAKNAGYQVWALFSNAFDPELTHNALKDFETRQKMIRELLHYSQMYQLDGINIDIENVNPEDGPLVTQFMREATPYFHEAGLAVSMDITFIAGGNWSAFYERDKLATIVDYLVVMAYDEHWGSSPVAGSVSSLPWVEKNLQRLLEIVPNEKLILGVPLYTRLWAETDAGEVSSKALSMQQAEEWLAANSLTPVYDEASGQNYAQVYIPAEGTTYKIWLEDELSLQKRADLASQYELAGVGSWSRYFANEQAWMALNMTNKQVTQK